MTATELRALAQEVREAREEVRQLVHVSPRGLPRAIKGAVNRLTELAVKLDDAQREVFSSGDVSPAEIWEGLNSIQRRALLRTTPAWGAGAMVNRRTATPSLRMLRDRLGLVEDGFAGWRSTALGRVVAMYGRGQP